MGGIFGVTSKEDCVSDLFFGTDYHSHLGTKRGGMVVLGENGFSRAIHNIENSPFRIKFGRDLTEMRGNSGIGCISDTEPQPLIVRSHLGNFAITTVGRINNTDELVQLAFENGNPHFLEMSGGQINPTELVVSLINQCNSIVEGIRYVQQKIDGSLTLLLLTPKGIYAARDQMGRTPLIVGKKDNARCVTFESFAYFNLGYTVEKELGPGEIVLVTPDGIQILNPPGEEMKICSFLWVYFGYPTSTYEGINVEQMRYNCGDRLAKRDNVQAHMVAGVPDSGTAHAIGYACRSEIPFARPFIKYTPTWSRSFMPQVQTERNKIARMKLIPVEELIRGRDMVLIDDSIVRGTQLRETTEFLYQRGAKEVHVRPACPPIMYGCKYLNFSRSTSDMDLIARRMIALREGDRVDKQTLATYTDPDHNNYHEMVEAIRKEMGFTTLKYQRLDDMVDSIGLDQCKLCTYCWDGKTCSGECKKHSDK